MKKLPKKAIHIQEPWAQLIQEIFVVIESLGIDDTEIDVRINHSEKTPWIDASTLGDLVRKCAARRHKTISKLQVGCFKTTDVDDYEVTVGKQGELIRGGPAS